jgi:hypothetical protein
VTKVGVTGQFCGQGSAPSRAHTREAGLLTGAHQVDSPIQNRAISMGPKTRRGRKLIPWRRDAVILTRLAEVERRHLDGENNTQIARALGVSEATIRNDLARLSELWVARIQDRQEELRAAAYRQLEEIYQRAMAAFRAGWEAESIALFGVDLEGQPAEIIRDRRGRVHGLAHDKAQLLDVARRATIDAARLMGLLSGR